MKLDEIVLLKDTKEPVRLIEIGEFIKHQFIKRPSDQGIRHSLEDYIALPNMAKDYINYERIAELSDVDFDIPLVNKALKLSEETGEVAQAVLKLIGSKNVSKSADVDDPRTLVLEELCDVINIAIDIINVIGYEDIEAKAMFEKKLDKWESKQKKY